MEALRNDAVVNDMLKNLEDDDYKTVISFIEYLTDSRKKKRAEGDKHVLTEIQMMFKDDKGWDNEGDMLADMAEFRRERMNA